MDAVERPRPLDDLRRVMAPCPPLPVDDRTPYVKAPAAFTFLLGGRSPGAQSAEERVALSEAGGGRCYADVRDVNVREKGGHSGP